MTHHVAVEEGLLLNEDKGDFKEADATVYDLKCLTKKCSHISVKRVQSLLSPWEASGKFFGAKKSFAVGLNDCVRVNRNTDVSSGEEKFSFGLGAETDVTSSEPPSLFSSEWCDAGP